MTAPARISQADMERATKAVKAGGFDRARIDEVCGHYWDADEKKLRVKKASLSTPATTERGRG